MTSETVTDVEGGLCEICNLDGEPVFYGRTIQGPLAWMCHSCVLFFSKAEELQGLMPDSRMVVFSKQEILASLEATINAISVAEPIELSPPDTTKVLTEPKPEPIAEATPTEPEPEPRPLAEIMAAFPLPPVAYFTAKDVMAVPPSQNP